MPSPVSGSFGTQKITEGLNPQQKEAVIHQGAPLLIMAGAGSGKTRVLTHRIAYLLETGRANPGEILAITFTNKAAAEMRERVQKLIGPDARRIWVSTFHSACVRMLREHHDAAGLKSTFSIYDQQDSLRLIQMVLRDLDVDVKRFTPRFVGGRISDLKNELVGPADYAKTAPSDPVSELVSKAYIEYQKRLRNANAVDFDDLIMKTVRVLQTHPAIAEGFHRRFRHILVDEYQDTNHAQYVLVRELVGDGSDGVAPGELTVVGDSDQSIYAFRGASIRNIEEFEQDYKNAKTVFLEQNYRSTQSILDAANSVISKNRGRRPKNLWTAEGSGDKIVLEVGDSEHDEARLIVAELDNLSMSGVDWGEIAIFYRTNAQSRAIEDRLIRAGIPYRIVGGTRFYERAEVKDALAYLQAVVNPDDVVAIRRVLNTPRRGIGDKAQATIAAHAERYGLSFGAALADTLDSSERPIDGLAVKARAEAAKFWTLLAEARTRDLEGESPAKVLDDLLTKTGYVDQLKASLDPQDASRVDNLAELVSVAEDFQKEWDTAALSATAETGTTASSSPAAGPSEPISGGITGVPSVSDPGSPQTPLMGFLERISLVADADQIPDESDRGGQVTLMTVHTAKGLEFPYVFVTGMEDGTFPHKRSMESESELAEERRLAYVALTRARKRLYLTRAASRSAWGAPEDFPPSRFLDDLPAEIVEVRGQSTREKLWSGRETSRSLFADSEWTGYGSDDGAPAFGSGSNGRSGTRPLIRRDIQRPTRRSTQSGGGPRSLAAGGESADDPRLSLGVGDRVNHATLGEGVVVGTEGSGRSKVANIEFTGVTKRLLLRMAPVTKI
ncbi:UvrD-helicase domain-containing protein [Actinomycetaceae bacterium MB13-C1-2]|nr:UvrD-helicase domain-containing protein [Actinomycetaceae bacterium MB13-C1-2]